MSLLALSTRARSFAHALCGGYTLLRTQANARWHALATVVVLTAGYCCHLRAQEWALLVFAIGLVWAAEALNTALEFLADEITQEINVGIGRAKDVAAFAVLCAAITALIIGTLVFLPHLM